MKTIRLALWLYAAAAGLLQPAKAAITFSVTPAVVSNTYSGNINLQIAGLTNTETVVVQKFLDLNTNGVIDGGDLLVQQFTLTDGQSGMVIGGVTNFNVPGDMDGTPNGQITATLSFPNGDPVQHLIGKYLLRLSSPVGHFTPVTNQFVVTNFPYLQKFTGNVVSNGTSITAPYAVVLLLPNDGHGPTLAGTVANNAGGYTLFAPSGTYTLLAFGINYIADMGQALEIKLSSGQIVTTNLTVIHATNNISGNLLDASSGTGLPGVMVKARQSASGPTAVAYTDTNGNYTVPVTAGAWKINADAAALEVHGYLTSNGRNANSGATNVTVVAPRGTALIYGSVKDNLGNAVVGLEMVSQDQNYIYDASGVTDTNGNYVVVVLGDLAGVTWQTEPGDDDFNSDYQYILNPQDPSSTVSSNTACLVNFTATAATNFVSGRLTDNYGNAIGDIEMFADATISGVFYHLYQVNTGTAGDYRINVCNGSWTVGVDDYSGQFNSPPLSNYICPTNELLVIFNNSPVVNFTATLLPPQVTTSSLPNGTNGVAYSQQISAVYGQPPYTWTNSSGVLPPGLNLSTNGIISGTPTTSGASHFTVQVTDAFSETATQALTLTVVRPLILLAPQVSVGKTNFIFMFSGPSGSNYVLQISTNLLNWSSVSTSAISVSGIVNLTNAISGYKRCFYRVQLP